jgi:archaellum component FlaC
VGAKSDSAEMPAVTLDFRGVCGCFYWMFISFMVKRAKNKSAMRVQVLKLRNRITGVMVGLLLTLLFFGDLIHRCGDVEKNPGPNPSESVKTRAAHQRDRSGSFDRGGRQPEGARAQGVKVNVEPTLKDVMSMLLDMNSKFDEMKDDMKDMKNSYDGLKEEVHGLREEVVDLRRVNDDLLNENEELKSKIGGLERAHDDLEGRSRRNNLLFYGVPKMEGEDCEGIVKDIITDKLELGDDFEFDRVHRLGVSKKSPIIARCTFFKQKTQILKAKKKLQETDNTISIGEDFTKRVRELRRKLTPFLKRAKEEGKRATLIFDHLLVEGQKYTVSEDGDLVVL